MARLGEDDAGATGHEHGVVVVARVHGEVEDELDGEAQGDGDGVGQEVASGFAGEGDGGGWERSRGACGSSFIGARARVLGMAVHPRHPCRGWAAWHKSRRGTGIGALGARCVLSWRRRRCSWEPGARLGQGRGATWLGRVGRLAGEQTGPWLLRGPWRGEGSRLGRVVGRGMAPVGPRRDLGRSSGGEVVAGWAKRRRAGRLGQEKKWEEEERFWPKRERMLSQI